ncbi:hypothetical protein GUITHDRAFT_81199 [Guillardia theta CCMP2712]|uniref:Glycerol-3-phosphate dehydrogenase [NAD(+)] n=1 Tax=Guillardia theta (strain CCMP2712) TaxID=905079 RepID=L1ICZ9_GUITC|nr:hypothetical protein GUITHDRAFT_81199 [Guillardia theta CCMP2712]EKX33715.1 hypothetical protein GUITHDRAFT_81199 [Guillardia theta CCMP2712]|eukprot:XP_005820695.1 hypothetical protein GUITHDRAFT_81199 [Guillardia theta CCMP2712]
MKRTREFDQRKQVAIVGSGAWGSAIARIIGRNCQRLDTFHSTVKQWVFEETVNGRKLTDIINQDHENPKYMPGQKLPHNVVADPDICSATKDADILIFVLPHQFLNGLCEKIKASVAPGCIGISLIKGVHFDEQGMVLISDMIKEGMGGMDMSVLMGANLAPEVAAGQFCEATIGCRDETNGTLLQSLFHDPNFHVAVRKDVPGVEICGALKNVVALGAGFVDGMGLGDNTKAAIIRIGMMEMKRFIQSHYPEVEDATFFESCGVADLIVTCYGGRNRKCAEAFVKAGGKKSFDELEAELLNGQKIQGTGTAVEVVKILEAEGKLEEYPLFNSIHGIAFEGKPMESLFLDIDNMGEMVESLAG